MKKIKLQKLDVKDKKALVSLMKDRVDVVIDVLSVAFVGDVAAAAMEAKVGVVNTMYGHMMPEVSHEKVVEKGITFMPESGLDPGIDLSLRGYGVAS